MGIDDPGEHSQNSDSGGGERPFKKAKYAWQVKGRSHLKENNSNTEKNKSQSVQDVKQSKNDISKTCDCMFSNKLLKNHNDYEHTNRLCQRCIYLNKILHHSENLMASDDDDDDDDDDNDDELDLHLTHVIVKPRRNYISISMVPKCQKNYDHYLSKWQARQIAKSFIDNAINGALEKCINGPLDDANDLIENCENEGFVEDEGILMAIQSHGLQSASATIHNNHSLIDDTTTTTTNQHDNLIDVDLISSDSNETTLSGKKTYSVSEQIDTNDLQSSSQSNIEIQQQQSSSSINFEHFDFLNTAVAVAIQKKGLNI